MLDSSPLLEFSHTHCVAICAFLVPANLLSTFQTIVYVGLKRPVAQIWQAFALASLFASLMVLHVLTWFVVGVVMLADVCAADTWQRLLKHEPVGGSASPKYAPFAQLSWLQVESVTGFYSVRCDLKLIPL
jgi:hypothetical protein